MAGYDPYSSQGGRADGTRQAILARAPLFVALCRPQMLGGVTYSFFVLNMVICTELFLISGSVLALGAGVVLHGLGYAACLREPRVFDLFLLVARRCPRRASFCRWGCNSYCP